jgi:hypothetical protein
MHPTLKCNPGDIVTEFLGDSVAAKYIVLEREFHEDYRGEGFVCYVSLIIYVCGEWSDFHKPGTLWTLDSQPITSAISYEVTFRSPLRWTNTP